MAKRIVCCPNVQSGGVEYFYVDTSKLLVENITGEVSVLVDDASKQCCFDKLSRYALGEDVLAKEKQDLFSFDFYKVNSFELFKSVDELRLKTGSEKILNSCLLNYYRREYDGTQQHTFFSEPGYSNTFVDTDGVVEHELVLENREIVKDKEKEIGELETLDKGKSDAEREAEAALAQAEAEQLAAMAAADEAEYKAEKRKKSRKNRQQMLEEEQYREFRNQDDVKREEYQRLRQYEEEMRRNNELLAEQYDAGNYSSLPGYVSNEQFANAYGGVETLGIAIKNDDLYRLASRMDEFGVPYTVTSETLYNGQQVSHLLYSSDYAEQGSTAKDFFVLEDNLSFDSVVSNDTYYNAFQLSALEYAYDNNVDTFYVQNGEYNSGQMYRIIDAGLNGHDMAVLANPDYSTPQMDVLTHYMNYGWDTQPISDPGISYDTLADNLMQRERDSNIPQANTFFESHDYSSFMSYGASGGAPSYYNDYDDSQRTKFQNQFIRQENENTARESFDNYKENLHNSYVQRQQEMNYLGNNAFVGNSASDYSGASHNEPLPAVAETVKYVDPDTHQVKTIPAHMVTPELQARCEKYWSDVSSGKTKLPEVLRGDGKKEIKPYSPNTSYSLSGANVGDSSHVSYDNLVGRGPTSGGQGGRGAPISRSAASDKIPFRRNPLDDLQVRSAFARRSGYIVQNYGSTLGNAVASVSRKAGGSISSADETGTVSAYRSLTNTVKNVSFAAGLIMDTPRAFSRIGQRMTYGSAAVEQVCRNHGIGNHRPISAAGVANDIKKANQQFNRKIEKLYGKTVANMSIRDINANIKKYGADIKNINLANKNLRGEIAELYSKKRAGKLSAVEAKALKNKLKAYNNNNAKISKKQRNQKRLEKVKSLKRQNLKNIKKAQRDRLGLGKKEGRWQRLPGMVAQGFVGLVSKAANDSATMGGLSQATSLAMRYARSPIRKLAHRGVSLLFKTSKKLAWKAVKNTKLGNKIRTKNIKKLRKKVKRIKRRQLRKKERIRKIKKGIKKASEKLFGKKVTKGLIKTSKAFLLAKLKLGNVLKAIKGFTGAFKGFLMKIAMYAGLGLVIIAILASVSNALMSASSSIMFGETDEDGKVDLSKYVNIINDCQGKLETEISTLANGKTDAGKPYDNVFYVVNGNADNNTAEIITMAYVRYGGMLTEYPDAVNAYMEQLYKDSNYVDYVISEPYECETGCIEREYKCYDEYDKDDKWVSETRKTDYARSDHSDEKYVGESADSQKGCDKSDTYYCTELGHGTYNARGCVLHNDGIAMEEPGKCDNYTKTLMNPIDVAFGKPEEYWYYCQGHCKGKHYDYSCPGHTEMICDGTHQDITITITCLGFDEIFDADSSIAEEGSTIRGDAYDDKYVISAYCSCHGCCHVTKSGKVLCGGKGSADCKNRIKNSTTASGTTPKANHTLAVDKDNPVVPIGTHVWIDGREYVVEDTGGFGSLGRDFDMYFDSHSAASQWGIRTKTVYKSVEKTEEGSAQRKAVDYLSLAKSAHADFNDMTNMVLQAFGQAKEPAVVWSYNRADYDDINSYNTKLHKYDEKHNNEPFTNVELNVFEYVNMSFKELKNICKKRGLEPGKSAYGTVTDVLIPYDKEHPDVYVKESKKEEYTFDGWTEENVEYVKNLHKILISDEGDEIYSGLDGVKSLNYGSSGSDFDFSGIVFDDASGLTTNQQKVLTAIKKGNIAAVSDKCQAWVADVYQAALGGERQSRCCANHAGEEWGVSNDWSKIQVGATVYGYSNSVHGHVGIYIGNGQVAENIGHVNVQSLERWVKTYNGQCWGWNGGINLSGLSQYNCKPAGTFIKGKH